MVFLSEILGDDQGSSGSNVNVVNTDAVDATTATTTTTTVNPTNSSAALVVEAVAGAGVRNDAVGMVLALVASLALAGYVCCVRYAALKYPERDMASGKSIY